MVWEQGYPSIVVVLINGDQIEGYLRELAFDKIGVDIYDQKRTQIIPASDINQIELRWHGSDLPEIDLHEMGELDGTSMEGLPVPTPANWHHRITRSGENKWLFQEISKNDGIPYKGEIYRARYEN